MLALAIGRRAVIRDLDATIAYLRGLTPADRERPTPCDGWEVRHLAAHLAESTRAMSSQVMACATLRSDDVETPELPREERPDARWTDILARITTGRNGLARALAHLEEHDLDQTIDGLPPCRRLLHMAVLEFGLHRSDIETSLGKTVGVGSETVEAVDALMGSRLDAVARRAMPDGPGAEPFAIRLLGDAVIDRTLAWDGVTWSMTPNNLPVSQIHGIDSTVVLFLAGRIPLSDRRIAVRGDPAIAGRFKEFVPGP